MLRQARCNASKGLGCRCNPLAGDRLAEGGRLPRQYAFLQRLGKISVAEDWEQIRRNFDGAIATEVMEHAVAFRLQEFRYDAHPSDSP